MPVSLVPPPFLTHIVFLCHVWDVRPFELSLIFLFAGPFVEVLPSFTLRMVPNILQGGHFWCLYLLWDFCQIVCFRVDFLFSWDTHFLLFISSQFVWEYSLPIFSSNCKFPFLRASWFFLDLVVQFLPSFDVFRFTLLVWQVFHVKFHRYILTIFSLPILGLPMEVPVV